MKTKMKVGAMIRVWWKCDNNRNMATILAILPYTGRYPKFSDCVLRLSAPGTNRGWVEMSYHSSDFARDSDPANFPVPS